MNFSNLVQTGIHLSMSTSQPSPSRLSYTTLVGDPTSLRETLEQSLGSKEGSLGVILIDHLPEEFAGLREKLFFLAHRLANLPKDEQEKLTHSEYSYLFGWSHGKEIMNGVPDTQKGSYYANPIVDKPQVSETLRKQHPEYYAGNVWPDGVAGLEEFEQTFKALGRIIFDVGCALARACESFVPRDTSSGTRKSLEELISHSQSSKARLLHYYPVPDSAVPSSGDGTANDALCGTHLDHSILTGLCSAMYLSQSSSSEPLRVVPAPSSSSGLYIYPRSSSPNVSAVKAVIPPDCLAFQTGEALQLMTGGKLAATPHFVSGNAPTGDSSVSVSRETFAFFLQPDVDEVIGPDGETFGGFSKRVMSRHYTEAMNEPEL